MEARTAAGTCGMRLIDGIEITAVEDGRDVHVLGVFLRSRRSRSRTFLDRQRADRVRRVREIGATAGALGPAVDVEALLEAAARDDGRSVGRPMLADALVAAGHAADRRDAFDRLLGDGRPAFVPRRGAGGRARHRSRAAAGGIASLAHPALTHLDARIPSFVDAGLAAIEVRHRDHDRRDRGAIPRAGALARRRGVGGSDFHGVAEVTRAGEAASAFGTVTLPEEDFAGLEARASSGKIVTDANPSR